MSGVDVGTGIAIAAALGGTALQYKAQQSAQDDRLAVLQRQMRTANEAEAEQRQALRGAVNQYEGPGRAEALEAAGASAGQQLSEHVDATRADTASPQYGGKVSNDYLATRATREAATLSRAHKLAQLMGRLQGSGDLFREEGYRMNDAALRRGQSAADYRSKARVLDTEYGLIEPDSRLMFLGDLLKVGGTIYGAGAGAGAEAAPVAGAAAAGGGGMQTGTGTFPGSGLFTGGSVWPKRVYQAGKSGPALQMSK